MKRHSAVKISRSNKGYYVAAGLNFAAAAMWLVVPNSARIVGFSMFTLAAISFLLAASQAADPDLKRHLWLIGLILVVIGAFIYVSANITDNPAVWTVATLVEVTGASILAAAYVAYHRPRRK